jgi:hypothetical protein
VSFDDRLPEHLAYFETRIHRDDEFIGQMLAEISIFLDELESTIQQITMKRAA